MITPPPQPVRIKFIPHDTMQKLIQNKNMHKEMAYVAEPYGIEDTVSFKKKAYTDNILDCTAVGLHNSESVSLFHLEPTKNKKAGGIRERISAESVALAKDTTPISGLLAGGRIWGDSSSKELKDRLEEAVKNKSYQIDYIPSICKIWGRKSKEVDGPMTVLYDAEDRCWYLNARHKDLKDVLTDADVRETYSEIEIPHAFQLITEDGVFASKPSSLDIKA